LGVSLTALRGYGASEVERAYASARELCYHLDAQDLMLPSLYGLWRFYLMRAEYSKAHSLMGDEAQAMHFSTEAIATARRLEHPFSRALSLSFAGWMHQFRGDLVALRESTAEAMAVSHEHGFEFWMGWNEALQAWANAIDGDPAVGAQQVADGIKRWTATGSELGKSYFLALQAQALLRAKQFDAAASVLEDALRFVAATHERFWEAELHRQLANCMEAVGRPAAEILSCREQALEVAQSQEAMALVRRCTLSAQRSFV
jgi:predicted ATPase